MQNAASTTLSKEKVRNLFGDERDDNPLIPVVITNIHGLKSNVTALDYYYS